MLNAELAPPTKFDSFKRKWWFYRMAFEVCFELQRTFSDANNNSHIVRRLFKSRYEITNLTKFCKETQMKKKPQQLIQNVYEIISTLQMRRTEARMPLIVSYFFLCWFFRSVYLIIMLLSSLRLCRRRRLLAVVAVFLIRWAGIVKSKVTSNYSYILNAFTFRVAY